MGNKISRDEIEEIDPENDEKEYDNGKDPEFNHYESNLKLFQSSSQSNINTLTSSFKKESTHVRRSSSLKNRRPIGFHGQIKQGSTDRLISEILELSKSFRSSFQSSPSVMSLERIESDESDLSAVPTDLVEDTNHNENSKASRVVENMEVETLPLTNGYHSSEPDSGDYDSYQEQDEDENDHKEADLNEYNDNCDEIVVEYFNHDADSSHELSDITPDFSDDGSSHSQGGIDQNGYCEVNDYCSVNTDGYLNANVEIDEARMKKSVSPTTDNNRRVRFAECYSPRSSSSEYSEAGKVILASLGDSANEDDSCPMDYDSCPSDSDSCPSDSDSCPSDSCPSDSQSETCVRSKDFHSPAINTIPLPRRGRMSAWIPPSIQKLEIHQQLKKSKKAKSCGAINEISDEFIEHLKFLKSSDSSFQAKRFDQFKEMAKAESEETGKRMMRRHSQIITKEEIEMVDKKEPQNIWNCPSLVRKSKIALAILFIGGRLGSVVQNNIQHMNDLAVEEGEIMAMSKATSVEKIGKLNRAMSFSLKQKNNIYGTTKKMYESSLHLLAHKSSKNGYTEYSQDCSSSDDKDTAYSSNRGRRYSDTIDHGKNEESFDMSDMRAKRFVSCSDIVPPLRDPRGEPRRAASTDDLEDNIANQLQVHSCESLLNKAHTNDRTDVPERSRIEHSEGKNDSSNEFSSDSDDRDERRSRITRSKSISAVTRGMFSNSRKSVLKKKSRCPPHNYTITSNKDEVLCDECQLLINSTENLFVRCTYCDHLIHRTCSIQVLNKSPPHRDKKSNKKLAWSTSNPVALLNKRPSNLDLRDAPIQNGGCKRLTSRDELLRIPSHERSGSVSEGSADEFSDGSDDYTDDWRNNMCKSVLSKMKKDDEKRLHSIHELITTERNHIRNLKLLVNVFRSRLIRKLQITEDDCSQLFPALDDLLNYCTDFYEDLKQEMIASEPHKTHRVGEILAQHFGRDSHSGQCIREAYAHLSANQKSATKLFREKCNKDKSFKQLNDHIESKRVCNRNTYSDLMLATATRLTKFPPLLEALLKHTPISHPDNKPIANAICVVKDALHYIDNRVREENLRRDLQIDQARFEVRGRCSKHLKHFDLSSSDRTFIRKDSLILRTKEKESKVVLFLFNDYILITKEKDNKLILNFDDSMYPVVRVKDCLAKDFAAEQLCFILISQAMSEKHSPLHIQNKPILYYLFTNTEAQKNSWIKLISEAAIEAKKLENSILSTDDSSDSDIDELENGVNFSLETPNETLDSIENEPDGVASFSPDSIQNHLDNIEEQKDYLPEEIEDDIENVIIFLKHLEPGPVRKRPSFNKPVPRPQKGAAARRATSLLVVEKQRKTEENRRHTTCLSKEELSQAISNSNKTLQDNPVRQKSSDSGYAAEESFSRYTTNPVMMKMRDAMLWMYNDNKRKSEKIAEQDQVIAKQQDLLQQHSQSIVRLQQEIKEMKSMPDQSNCRHRSRQIPAYSSITEEITEPQTRV